MKTMEWMSDHESWGMLSIVYEGFPIALREC